MIHGDFQQYQELDSTDAFSLQNKKLLKVLLQYGPVKAKVGSMVAYQGDANFSGAGSGGMAKFIKKATTGEGVTLMDVSGTGEAFLAELKGRSLWRVGFLREGRRRVVSVVPYGRIAPEMPPA